MSQECLISIPTGLFLTSNHTFKRNFALFAQVQEDEAKSLVGLLTGEAPLDSIAAEGFFVAGQKYATISFPFAICCLANSFHFLT